MGCCGNGKPRLRKAKSDRVCKFEKQGAFLVCSVCGYKRLDNGKKVFRECVKALPKKHRS